ncbi:MAG: MBL fold metallo-hydrolase, partial [Myxococcota bacterium]
MEIPVIRLGAVSVYLGEKSGKYPDGNQVTVRGADTLAAFDTPLVANRLGA